MFRIMSILYILVFAGFSFYSCSHSAVTARKGSGQQPGGAVIPAPPCIVYKTKKDLNNYVPVILSDDKLQIVSYPDVRDVYFRGELAYPSKLSEGYLLDNRGIGVNVAFLDFTYEAYSKLDRTPTTEELLKHLLDTDPVLEMYDCGSRSLYSNPAADLNKLIKSGGLKEHKRLK